MRDVAVLLNLTPKLTFEETDPLMELVVGGGALLFYDRLSVEKVRVVAGQDRVFMRERVAKLRNLLESRSLSKDDDNERIRLIVTLDLGNPAEKASEVRQTVKEAFGESSPLLRRLVYCFVFVYTQTHSDELKRFYDDKQYQDLAVEEFRGNSVFFLMKADGTPLKVKRTDETYVKSLVQLLSTMSPQQFDTILLASTTLPPNLFVSGNNDRSHITASSFGTLNGLVGACKPLLQSQTWTEDREVCYHTFAANAESSAEIDTHTPINSENEKKRIELHESFCEARELPFFFAKKAGDFNWYDHVLEEAEKVYRFEEENDRPLHDDPKRITEKEMSCREQKCSYSELEERRRKLLNVNMQIPEMENMVNYLHQRHSLMEDFKDNIDKLRKELLRLGFLSNMLWISLVCVVLLTLCYTVHFLLPGNADNPAWIAACFVAITLLLALSALVGGACVKASINKVYRRMDQLHQKMKDLLQDHLNAVRKRVDKQREADVQKRNLDEMKAKLDEFERHNKRVEIWLYHYGGMIEKLNNAMETFEVPTDRADNVSVSKTSTTFYFDGFPCLPNTISSQFRNMSTRLTPNDSPIGQVTCFVDQFAFVREML